MRTVPDNGYVTFEHDETKRNIGTSGNTETGRTLASTLGPVILPRAGVSHPSVVALPFFT
jgi:hypothetical protein